MYLDPDRREGVVEKENTKKVNVLCEKTVYFLYIKN